MHLKSRSKILRVSYAFIGATQSDSVAGGQWTLTSSLIEAVQGKAGLDRYQDGVIDFADFVSYTADKHAQEKKNRISVRLFGNFRPNTVLFVIDMNSKTMAPRRPPWPGQKISSITSKSFCVDDNAFVKYEGGYEKQQSSITYIPPNWYPCKVKYIETGKVAIVEAKDEFGNTWTMSSTPPNLLPSDYFSAAVRKPGIQSVLGRYRTPNPIIRETKKVLKSMYKEATNKSNPIKKRAGNVLVEGTVGAVSVGFAFLDTGAELLKQQSIVRKTPMLANMMEEQHKRAKARREAGVSNAKIFFKNFF